nr:hypothetical protein CFP56_75117 [Quercus suber]
MTLVHRKYAQDVNLGSAVAAKPHDDTCDRLEIDTSGRFGPDFPNRVCPEFYFWRKLTLFSVHEESLTRFSLRRLHMAVSWGSRPNREIGYVLVLPDYTSHRSLTPLFVVSNRLGASRASQYSSSARMAPPKIWHKRVLIPFFVIEILWSLIFIATGALSIIAAQKLDAFEVLDSSLSDQEYDAALRVLAIIAGVFIAVASITLILDLTAIILWARHRLMPATQVAFTSVKTFFWLVIFVLKVAAVVRSGGLGFIWSIVLLYALHSPPRPFLDPANDLPSANSLGQLIYASVILHRYRKGNFSNRGTYTAAPMPVMGPAYDTAYNSASPFRGVSTTSSGHLEPFRAPHTEYYSPDAVTAASRREEHTIQQSGYNSQV